MFVYQIVRSDMMRSSVGKILTFLTLLTVLCTSQSSQFKSFKDEMEAIVTNLTSAYLELSMNVSKNDTCPLKSYEMCQGTSEKWCNKQFPKFSNCGSNTQDGAYVPLKSGISFPKPVNETEMTEEEIEFVCLSARLQSDFSNLDSTRKQRFGHVFLANPSGSFRVYPSLEENCNQEDPRSKPWYTAAITGSKNMIIMIDTSAEELPKIKEAARKMLASLSFIDYVAVFVLDKDGARNLGDPQFMKANYEAVTKLADQIDKQKYASDIAVNFTKCREDLTSFLQASTNSTINQTLCSNSTTEKSFILFTGSGVKIQSLNQGEINVLKNYSGTLEPISFYPIIFKKDKINLMKELSCNFNGTVIVLNENETEKVYEYFYYVSLQRKVEQPIWSQIYSNANGFDNITTVSFPIYYTGEEENSTYSHVVAVVGIDVFFQYMAQLNDSESSIQYFNNDSDQIEGFYYCAAKVQAPCLLDYFRKEFEDLSCPLANCSINYSRDIQINMTDQKSIFAEPVKNEEQSCCRNIKSNGSGDDDDDDDDYDYGWVIAVGIIVFIVILLIIIFCCVSKKKGTEKEGEQKGEQKESQKGKNKMEAEQNKMETERKLKK